jgi:hypothetical protein
VLTVATPDSANLGRDLTNAGTITLGDAGTNHSWLCCYAQTLTNTGHLNTVLGGGGNRYLWANVTNAPGGTIDIAGTTPQDGGGGGSTRTTNNGTLVVEATGSLAIGGGGNPMYFVNSGGSITNNGVVSTTSSTFTQRGGTESGNPIVLGNVSVLDDDLSAGAALFKLANGSQNLTGTGTSPGIAAGQTLTVAGNDSANLYVDLTNAGTITLGDASSGNSWLCCSGHTLTNSGHLNTVVGGGGNRYLQANITNAAGGTIDIGGPTFQDGAGGGATGTTNNGMFTIEAGRTLPLGGGSTFTQGAGGTFATTIDATATTFGQLTGGGGSVSLNGKLKVTTVGSPATSSSWPVISSANRSGQFSSLDFGLLNYAVQYPATGVTLVAQAPCDYWIGGNGNFSTAGNWSTGAVPTSADDVCVNRNTTTTPKAALDSYTVLVDGNVTVNTLTLGAPSGNQTLQLAGNNTQFYLAKTSSINPSGVLNVGDNNVANGNTLLGSGGSGVVLINTGRLNTVQGGGGIRYLRANIINAPAGSVDVGASTIADFNTTIFTNNGTFTVEAGVTFAISNGSSFTNLAGSVTNLGSLSQNGNTFTQRGGTETGNPVFLQSAILDDDLAAGGAKFVLSGGDITGSGTQPGVATGQVVTLAADGMRVLLDKSLTNAGTITLGDAGTGISWLGMGTNTFVLTNTGHLTTVPGGGGIRYLRANIINAPAGSVDLAAPDSRQDFSAASTINNGAFIIEPGSIFYLIGGSTFTQGAGGTFQTTIDANAMKFGQLTGGGDPVSLNGTLKVITVGHPVLNSSWPIISNANRSGMFPSLDFGGWNYDVQYPPTAPSGVTLVARGTCNVWIGGDGAFSTPTNWSLGFMPTSVDDACITATTTTTPPAKADTYTVLVNGDFPVNSLTLGGANGTQTLDIQSGKRLTLLANSSINARGVMILGDAGNGDAWLGCPSGCLSTGPVLTNSGTVKTVQGGGGRRHVQTFVVNAAGGTIDIAAADSVQDGGCHPPGGMFNNDATINNGAFTVEATATFTGSCGFANNPGGTVTNQGTFTVLGSLFKQRGTEMGNAVILNNGSGLDDDTSAGHGSFTITSASGGISGTGTSPGIPAGQVVTVASGTTVQVFPNATNSGTLILGDSGNGDSALCCAYFTSGATITNTGTIKTVQGGGGIRHLQVNVANAAGGIIDIATDTRQDQACGTGGANATSITNSGTFTIEATGHYSISNCPAGGYQNTFTQGPGGTFQTTINGNAISVGQLSGGIVNLDGRLKVTTVGSPGVGYVWRIIDGAQLSARPFASLDLDNRYSILYSASSLILFVDPCGLLPPAWSCRPAVNPPASTPGGPWWRRP